MWRRAARTLALVSLPAVLGGAAFISCNDGSSNSSSGDTSCTTPPAATQASQEWVNFHTEVPFDPSTFDGIASGLFGAGAQAGKFVTSYAIETGVTVSAAAEPTTPDQTRLTFAFDDGTNPQRVLAVAPASFEVGGLYITTVDAAISTMQAEEAMQPGSSESWFLEYRVASAMGGTLSFGIRGVLGVFTLVVDVTSPHTNLAAGKIGTPVGGFAPYDTVAGTVYFHLTQDEFDFFSSHAYGQGAESQQNFTDFALVPHTWLRLTVQPHLQQEFVDVGFDVLTNSGQRIPVSEAPASTIAGSTFQALTNRYVTNMLAEEAAMPGSSTPWQVPFYYDSPNGGGVVEVIAQSDHGTFEIAYAIVSPQHTLNDVPFVAYEPVKFVPPSPQQTESCQQLGNKLAPRGTFDVTFTASSVVTMSPNLKGPLKGTIYCSVFNASDVTIAGPNADAKSLQDFNLPNADLMAATAPAFTTNSFFDGDYQILCYQDLFGTGMTQQYDPVTLPIGSYTIACDKNPVTVQFALLDPESN
jgi:hypothetical protein